MPTVSIQSWNQGSSFQPLKQTNNRYESVQTWNITISYQDSVGISSQCTIIQVIATQQCYYMYQYAIPQWSRPVALNKKFCLSGCLNSLLEHNIHVQHTVEPISITFKWNSALHLDTPYNKHSDTYTWEVLLTFASINKHTKELQSMQGVLCPYN